MTNSGIYIVKLRNTEALPINGNPEDVHVNFENIHVGATENLERRKADFNRTFGEENVNFIPVVEIENPRGRMNPILEALTDHRITPRHQWLQGVGEEQVVEAILCSIKEVTFPYRLVYSKVK